MTYGTCSLRLSADLAQDKRALLGAQLRSIKGVVAASVGDKALTVWYKEELPLALVRRLVKRMEEECAPSDPELDMAGYRREAIFSLASFAGMKALEKLAPEAFAGMKVFRSLLVLAIARNFLKNGVVGMVKERRPNADTLTSTAVIASVLAGKPESSLTLLTLSNGAEMLTAYAAERAKKQISGLLNMNQRFVWLVDGGVERKVAVESVQVGDRIAAHSGEMICVDGRVVSGKASVNQASITGESNPAMKREKSPVYAGSVIEVGEIVIEVEKTGKDTSLAHIVHLVEEAQSRRAPVQNFADNMANMLVPSSFLGAAIVYGATRDWQRVLNLLFIDFSCGLKLSTATAISASIAAAAKKGILVKGGNYMEALANTDTVVLDKTGTITVGIPQISSIKTAEGVTEKEMILLAASAEMHSVHPLAVAIQKYVKDNNWEVPQHRSSKTIVARGMQAVVPDFAGFKGGDVIVGSYKFMKERGVQGAGELVVEDTTENLLYIARNGSLMGIIGITDPVRPKMKKTLNQMRRMDIDSYHAEVLPEDKANYVMKLKERGGRVMMVGDGINDAPALAFADVGVTLGGRQTDIAAESSAVTIRSEDPEGLVDALRLGKRTMGLIHQNFRATILVNSGAMLMGALGMISPLWAAVIHNTATLAVVLNSARILSTGKKPIRRVG